MGGWDVEKRMFNRTIIVSSPPDPLSEGEGEGLCEDIVFIGLCIGAVAVGKICICRIVKGYCFFFCFWDVEKRKSDRTIMVSSPPDPLSEGEGEGWCEDIETEL
jgi:hypothetical protein